METSSWIVRDRESVWHPFTQAQIEDAPIPIVQGSGAYLIDHTGKAYLDAVSSWWVNLHGHAHPYIAAKIKEQAETLEHVLFAGYTHPQAIVLAERLLKLAPKGYSRVFYSDNGSTAVEVAIKMALQAAKKKGKILSFEGGYHGDTFGAMAASGKTPFNRPFWPYLFEVVSIPPPLPGKEEDSYRAFESAIKDDEIAAFLFEPLIQGVGGMRMHCKNTLNRMIEACRLQNILTIADEVMTGFGRTGPLFASSYFSNAPDVLCLSKGITGGFLPLGATLASRSLFEAFLSPDPQRAFLHGHSYTANPLCCAAANASLDLLIDPACAQARRMIEEEHRSFLKQIDSHPKLLRAACLGTILALEYRTELSREGTPLYHHPIKRQLSQHFKNHGIIVRPLGNVLSLLPPYCISPEELKQIYSAILQTLKE
jgi:adenosylmethionine-8-amino-7-oxononanoate aminotransferase